MSRRKEAIADGVESTQETPVLGEPLAVRIPPGTPAGEVRAQRLKALLPRVAILAALQGLHILLAGPPGAAQGLASLSLVVGGACALLSWLLHRRAITTARAVWLAALSSPFLLLLSLFHVSTQENSSRVLVLASAIIAIPSLPFPLGWITVLQGVAVVASAVVASSALSPALPWPLAAALVIAALLSSPLLQRRFPGLATIWDGGDETSGEGSGSGDSGGGVVSLTSALTDHAAEQVFRDRLTGLPSRAAFLPKLQQAVEQARGSSQERFIAVMVLDLDGFKRINDSLSYADGDQLLAAVASRLRGSLRRQRSYDFVARFGADEFAVILQDLRKPDDALKVATRIQTVLGQAFQIGQQQIRIGASIGVAVGSRTGSAEDLLWNADTAMRHVKSSRKGTIEIFTPRMHSEVVRFCELRSDLWKALERDELFLHYQPLISLRSGKIEGAEALLRWRHEGEVISPLQFIPIAEETRLIEPIGEWVLKTACAQSAAWQKVGLPPVPIAVNLSAHQLHQRKLARIVSRALAEAGLSPEYLELELTESALMDNIGVATAVMRQLSEMGAKVSIDDFGTGYSSFSYLKHLPCNKLKMDRSFVADLTTDAKSAAIVAGLINLAHNLDLQVTAEGVESEAQLSFLRTAGCDQMQGQLVSEPLETQQFAELLASDFNLYRLASLAKGL